MSHDGKHQATAATRRIVRPADPGWRPTPEAELAHLRLCWGRLYLIGFGAESGQWVARYLGSAEQMMATSPLELRQMIRDDWNARPPRQGWNNGRTDAGISGKVGKVGQANGGSGDMSLSEDRARVLRAAGDLIGHQGLCVREEKYELVITNPADPEKGQVSVAYEDGFVSWGRMVWEHWGPLESYPAAGEKTITSAEIVKILTDRQ